MHLKWKHDHQCKDVQTTKMGNFTNHEILQYESKTNTTFNTSNSKESIKDIALAEIRCKSLIFFLFTYNICFQT